jgi:hypothetical protein
MSIEGVQDFVRTSLGQFSLGDNISAQKMGRRYAMNQEQIHKARRLKEDDIPYRKEEGRRTVICSMGRRK